MISRRREDREVRDDLLLRLAEKLGDTPEEKNSPTAIARRLLALKEKRYYGLVTLIPEARERSLIEDFVNHGSASSISKAIQRAFGQQRARTDEPIATTLEIHQPPAEVAVRPEIDRLAEREDGPKPAPEEPADLLPIGPADRLRYIRGSRPEPSVFEPTRAAWMYLYNKGGSTAKDVEIWMGPQGHTERIPEILPGEVAEVRWPPPSYRTNINNHEFKGGTAFFRLTFQSRGEMIRSEGNIQLHDDGRPNSIMFRPGDPNSRTFVIR